MIALPIAPSVAIAQVIVPALALLPERMDSPTARVQLVAMALQETRLNARRQFGNGPARGLWQFEQGGGVKGVLTHPATKANASTLCYDRRISYLDQTAVWSALENDDVLAAAFARLFLWTDKLPLPALGDVDGAWSTYRRVWRPGQPHPETWPGNYRQALDAIR